MGTGELPLVLRASVWQMWAASGFFAFCGFAAVANGLNGLGDWFALLGSAVFVLVGAAFILVRPRLEITETTITMVGPFVRKSFDLSRCGPFRVWRYGGMLPSRIAFDYEGRRRGRLGWLDARYGAPNSSVPSYDYDAEQLAVLLNEVRADALRT
jgi:hypothetical protein